MVQEPVNKILIGIPTGEFPRSNEHQDFLDLLQTPPNSLVFTSKAHGQSPARNRNSIIKQALESDCTHIFFVDDDCLLPPDTLVKLLAHDVDVVTGLYLMRNHPNQPILFDVAMDDGKCQWHNLTESDFSQGLIEIVATGLGCCLIKIDVFKKIAETHKYWVTLGELESDHWCDDLSFFKRVREAGIKIHCDVKVPVGHVGKVAIWPNYVNGWKVDYDTQGKSRVQFAMQNLDSIPSLKAPNDPRNTWRNGIIQVHVTRACDLSCTGCTQGSNLAGKPVVMSPEQFEEALISLKGYQGVIGMFGGNPCVHPQFEELCRIFQRVIPFEQRGLWSNNLRGHGKLCRETFNPEVSNLNVHGDLHIYTEMINDWPECKPIGIKQSRHSPPYVAIKDMEDLTRRDMFDLIQSCDINKFWSAMVCVFRNELRGFFCELAGAQSMLHQNESDYPDTGVKLENDWWKQPIEYFGHQVLKHCFECGIPLRGVGDFDNGSVEYISQTHANIYKPKISNRIIKLVRNTKELNGHVQRATDYIANGELVATN